MEILDKKFLLGCGIVNSMRKAVAVSFEALKKSRFFIVHLLNSGNGRTMLLNS
jgi:hypothetical protein